MEIDDLKKRKDAYITKIFWLGLKIAVIFAVPAVLGSLLGKKLQEYYNMSQNITIFILIGTFIFSWIVVLFLYNKLVKQIKDVDAKIADEKEKSKLSNK